MSNDNEEIIDLDEFNTKLDNLNISQINLTNKIDDLFDKLNVFENSVISINSELIKQNIILNNENKELKLKINSSTQINDEEQPPLWLSNAEKLSSNNILNKILTKELFYKNINNKIIISGSGTYDAKEILKSLGASWNDFSKVWEGNIDLNLLKENFPNIKEQE